MASAVVVPPKQVLGEVEPRVGEESRARHAVGVDQTALALVADDAAEVPDEVPEGGGSSTDQPCSES